MNQQNSIRNFSIIAHIDHGKTTLTDRFLELTKTVEKRLMHERFLDSHPISQERGVTIKLAPVRMNYQLDANNYILNLIDTPGHIDFSYEVSRSLQACEGAVLLVDATQGIQAQTLAHFHLAQKLGLKIVPVINKIDLENSEPQKVAQDLVTSFGFNKQEIIFISAKTGENIDSVFKAVVERVPFPSGDKNGPLRALVFDSFYHNYKGVVIYIRVVDGSLDLSRLKLLGSSCEFDPLEIGYISPGMVKQKELRTGEVGYVATGLKDISLCQVGDTLTSLKLKVKSSKLINQQSTINHQPFSIVPLPGYRQPKPVVFFDFYPTENKDYAALEEAINTLKLNDFSLFFTVTGSPALGKGLRVGFLGVFHAMITQERLERDYNLDLVMTSPSVEYELFLKDGSKQIIHNASDLPDLAFIKEIREPWVKLNIFSPIQYIGPVFELCQEKRGRFIDQQYYGSYVNLDYELPLIELIEGFYDQLKSVTSGFASLDYQLWDFRAFEAVKLEVIISREKIDALGMIVEENKAEYLARILAKKLKDVIPRQQFEVMIQVSLNNRIAARETIKAFRKDVTQKLYGGDRTRRDKLLKKQKKGKKRMKMVGSIIIPQEAFMAVLEVK